MAATPSETSILNISIIPETGIENNKKYPPQTNKNLTVISKKFPRQNILFILSLIIYLFHQGLFIAFIL